MNARGLVLICSVLVFFPPSLFAAIDDPDSLPAAFDEETQTSESINDYTRDESGEDRDLILPVIGVAVREETGRAENGAPLAGVGVLKVVANSPADSAGLRGQLALLRTTAVVALFAGGMFFPPAMLGAMVLEQSDIGDSHDLILAVDGYRTRSLMQFQRALARAEPGEIVYLSAIRGGERHQFRVRLPGDAPHRRTWY